MAVVIVDSSTIISCAMNCLMWVFRDLKEKGFRFVIPLGVKREVVDRGLESKRFKYEALRVLSFISDKTFEVYDGDLKKETSELLQYANSSFYIKNNPMRILQDADAEVAALAIKLNADAILTDERTLRLLIESPNSIKESLQKKFSAPVKVNESLLYRFNSNAGAIDVIRSTELIALGYSLGIFNTLMEKCTKTGEKNCEKKLIEGFLYSLKFSGCSISFEEINDYINLLLKVR